VNLAAVKTFSVSSAIVRQTEDVLRDAGRDGYEMFVLWSGAITGTVFDVRTPHAPRQTSYKTEDGLLVRVDGDALHQLNSWLHHNNEVLGVQIHAHPTDAFHSDTDDAFPIVTAVGGLSIVIPDFAQGGMLVNDTAAYRLTPSAAWKQVALRDILEVN
jgi:hypothetical protein